ncbi:DNA-directed RNA polymerase III subunit C19 [Puccinia sorghi]|uniref:DNA-directed RNA polymerases I and III subunit RPAC2 n=1 Tax=Puccinia sorghi TaxID=27349 RepID=A0A0L6VA37_9BASI|nr:DNA-directed RNA polymerase III subunit C19 [Puccinia sorghi]
MEKRGKPTRRTTKIEAEPAPPLSSMDLDPTNQLALDAADQPLQVDPDKVTILPGKKRDAMTFSLKEEDHTLGNSLRYIIMKNPDVEFCGYSLPHPSEPKLHLRIQMYENKSAMEALSKGLEDLEQLVLALSDRYRAELERGNFRRFEEPTVEQRLDNIKRHKYPHLLKDHQGDIPMNS